MAARYQLTKGSVALSKKIELEVVAQIRRNVKSGNAPQQITKFVDNSRSKIYEQAKAYYAGTLEAAGRFIHSGALVDRPVLLDSSRRQSVSRLYTVNVRSKGGLGSTEEVTMTSGRRKSEAWKGLPLKYVAVRGRRSKAPGEFYDPQGKWKGLPISKKFWRKTGILDEAYQAWLATNTPRTMFFERESTKTLSSKIEFISGPRDKGQNLWQSRMQIRFPDLGNPAMNAIFRRSFATLTPGKFRVYQRDGLGRKFGAPRDISRIAYPEYSRPILARFAAEMGRKHRAALVKLLKTI